MKSLKNRMFKQGLVSVVIVSLSMCSTAVISVAAQASPPVSTSESSVLLEDHKKEKVSADTTGKTSIISEEPPFVVNDPAVTVDTGEGIDGMTMLYIGGAVGLVAIGAVALGGGSGSSSDSGTTPLPSTTPVVGPNLNGTNWLGFLDIKNTVAIGFQNISASIVQSGASVKINTTSTLSYGQYFDGSISSGGSLRLHDLTTGKTWTTHNGPSTTTRVDLYDYVNDLSDLDRMLLSR